MSIFDKAFNADDNFEYSECSEAREDILKALAKELTIDDISYMCCERMKLDKVHKVITRQYDSKTDNGTEDKLIYFRMKAEHEYYLDDNDEFYLDGDEEDV